MVTGKMRTFRTSLLIFPLICSVLMNTPTATSVQYLPQLFVLSRTDDGYSLRVTSWDDDPSSEIAVFPRSSQTAFVEMMPAYEIESARAFLVRAGAALETVESLMQSYPNITVTLLATSPDGKILAAAVRYESCAYSQRTCFGRTDVVLLSTTEHRTVFTLGSTGNPSIVEFEGIFTSNVRVDAAAWLAESDTLLIAASSEISRQNARGSILVTVPLHEPRPPQGIAWALNWTVSVQDKLLVTVEDVGRSDTVIVREVTPDGQLRTMRLIPLGDTVVDRQLRLSVMGKQVLIWTIGNRTSITSVGGLIALDIESDVPDFTPVYSHTYVSRIVPLSQLDAALVELTDGHVVQATLSNRVFSLVDLELPQVADWWLSPDHRSVLLQFANDAGFAVYDVNSGAVEMVDERSRLSIDSTTTLEILW
ncbi:MAG: hypothetical protein IPM16_16385 [Chloroflexi bacterium]|nr:hypothetical protein [Chloroflexota bacterium]